MYGAILDQEPVRVILVTALFLGVATRESRYVRVTAPIVKRWIALWMHARRGELPVPKTVCDGCHNLSESTPMTSYLLCAVESVWGIPACRSHTVVIGKLWGSNRAMLLCYSGSKGDVTLLQCWASRKRHQGSLGERSDNVVFITKGTVKSCGRCHKKR